MKKPQRMLIPIAILLTLLIALFYFANRFAPYRYLVTGVAAGLAVLVTVITWAVIAGHEKKQLARMDEVFSENAGTAARVIREVSVPCLLVDDGGRITWRNEIMQKLYAEDDLSAIMPDYNFVQPQAAYAFEYAGGSYQIMSRPVRRKSTERLLTFQYWLDRTEAAHYKRLYEEKMPYVALVYVDNFDELVADQQFHRTTVLTEVERLVAETAASLEGIYRRYENGRFLLIFEAKRLETLETARFAMLEQAHRIDTGTSGTVSLSVAVGVADRIAQSDESARQAMELALGRGGDQAVVKRGVNYTFYGGKRQRETMQSRVKARLFAKALRQLFENAGDVIVMGHKNADMDSLGAALGVVACAKMVGSRAFIVLDEPNETIEIALSVIRQNAAYADCIISPEHAERMWRPSSVLVVVDTQRPGTTCAPRLVSEAARIVLIDHHRRSADYIDNSTLHFLESRASSAAELVTETLQYFDDNPRIPAFVCSALLAGITVDTKHFVFNVGSRTFEAAGYLRKNGADISMIKQMFQDDMDSYRACSEVVRSAEVLDSGVAVACCGEKVENAKLIAAKAADQLIDIRGIEASFALGRDGDVVSVSGRSLGRINVQIICERLGGGGHLTMAGAQLHGVDMEEARAMVKMRVEEYLQEVSPT